METLPPKIIVTNNIRNALTALSAQLMLGAVHLLMSPIRIYLEKQRLELLHIAEVNFKNGFDLGVKEGEKVGYGVGMENGFVLGQQNMLQQIQAQRPPEERWD